MTVHITTGVNQAREPGLGKHFDHSVQHEDLGGLCEVGMGCPPQKHPKEGRVHPEVLLHKMRPVGNQLVGLGCVYFVI